MCVCVSVFISVAINEFNAREIRKNLAYVKKNVQKQTNRGIGNNPTRTTERGGIKEKFNSLFFGSKKRNHLLFYWWNRVHVCERCITTEHLCWTITYEHKFIGLVVIYYAMETENHTTRNIKSMKINQCCSEWNFRQGKVLCPVPPPSSPPPYTILLDRP